MYKSNHKSFRTRRADAGASLGLGKPRLPRETLRGGGFSLIELMISMALGLIVLGMAFTFFNDLYNAGDLTGSTTDVNENLRAAVNVLSSDLSTAGTEIPNAGIPIPNGGTATPIKRPAPAGAGNFSGTTIQIITPGPGLGPTSGSGATAIPTDAITLISVNQSSLIDNYNLTSVTASAAAATITLNASTDASWKTQITPGQLIALENTATTWCLLTVTAVNTSTNVITFTHGDAKDVLGLNQFSGPTGGTIYQLQSGGTFSLPITAFQVNMVTYYLDSTMCYQNPLISCHKLMKQVLTDPLGGAANPAQPVALGINVLQFWYSLPSPGCAPASTPPDPCRTPTSANSIRKVNVLAIGQSDHPNKKTGRYFSNSIWTANTIQNLAYYNKY